MLGDPAIGAIGRGREAQEQPGRDRASRQQLRERCGRCRAGVQGPVGRQEVGRLEPLRLRQLAEKTPALGALDRYRAQAAAPVEPKEPADRQLAEAAASQRLEEQVQKIKEAGGEIAQAYPRIGRPYAEIVHLAEELGVGIVVVGSRGEGRVRRALMGSVADWVVRNAHFPVLVVR